jgi:energy-converting hydrogenase Eha subunit A
VVGAASPEVEVDAAGLGLHAPVASSVTLAITMALPFKKRSCARFRWEPSFVVATA